MMLNLIWLSSFVLTIAAQQKTEHLPVKFGGVNFRDVRSFVQYMGTELFTISAYDGKSIPASFPLYSKEGKLQAKVVAGKFTGENQKGYTLKNIATELSCVDSKTNRIICLVKKIKDKTGTTYHFEVWMDIFLPDGNSFMCNPDESNLVMLESMRGSSFVDCDVAVTVN